MPAAECVLPRLQRTHILPEKAIRLRGLCSLDFPGQLFKCHQVNTENRNFAIDPRGFMCWELGLGIVQKWKHAVLVFFYKICQQVNNYCQLSFQYVSIRMSSIQQSMVIFYWKTIFSQIFSTRTYFLLISQWLHKEFYPNRIVLLGWRDRN